VDCPAARKARHLTNHLKLRQTHSQALFKVLAHQENSNNSCSENGKENAGMLHPHASFAEEDFS
jgi:hypothetical protein